MIEDTIASGVYQYVAGDAAIMALMVIAIVVIMLFAIRAGKVVILMLLIPLIMTLGISTALIEVPKYLGILIWLIAGFVFGAAILAFASGS